MSKIWTPKRPPIIGADNFTLASMISRKKPAAWLPTDVAGCILWLRSDLGITKDGGNLVSAWADQSDGGNNAIQNTAADKPTWAANIRAGHPALLFNGTESHMSANALAASLDGDDTPYTFFWAFQITAEVGTRMLFSASLDGASFPLIQYYASMTGGRLYYSNRTDPLGGGGDVSGGLPDTSWHYAVAVYTGTAVLLVVDGVTAINTAQDEDSLSTMDVFWIGATPNSGDTTTPQNLMMGYIAECGAYNSDLAGADRSLLEAYLAERYTI